MHTPTEIHLHQKNRELEVVFDTGERFMLPCEYLRVYSPSAEVRGHASDQAVLQTGKRYVNIISIEPVGHYAVKLVFDDGHKSGLYSWDWLYNLGCHQSQYWQTYLERLATQGASREPQP